MNEPKIKRYHKTVSVTLASTETESQIIRYEDAAGGGILIGTTNTTVTTIAVWAASSEAATFRKLRKVDGTAVEITLAPSLSEGRAYPIPDEAFSFPAIKLVTNSGSGIPANISLKG